MVLCSRVRQTGWNDGRSVSVNGPVPEVSRTQRLWLTLEESTTLRNHENKSLICCTRLLFSGTRWGWICLHYTHLPQNSFLFVSIDSWLLFSLWWAAAPSLCQAVGLQELLQGNTRLFQRCSSAGLSSPMLSDCPVLLYNPLSQGCLLVFTAAPLDPYNLADCCHY